MWGLLGSVEMYAMMTLPNRSWPETNRPSRSGQVLIEFSFIVLILYILMAVTVDFGRALYSAQVVQQAADVMARELSRTPLPPGYALNDALNDPSVLGHIFNPDLLVIVPAPDD